MSIANEIRRILAAKSALKSAINAKGGTLTGEILDDYAPAVLNISTGADVSQVTVTAGDMLAGKTAVASDGKLITGTITAVVPVREGNTVNIASGFLAENYSFTVESGGIDTSDATVTADKLLAGVTAYGASGKITGSIETVSPTVIGNTVDIPVGFISTAQQLTIPLAAEAQVSGNTVTLFPGYQASEKVIAIGTTHPGGVFTPGISDQEIASDTYLSGAVTLKGDKNLLSGNIRSGVTLFGVSGSYGGNVIVGDMEFFKCAAVHGPYQVQTVIVSGCPNATYDGEYLLTEFTTVDWGGQTYPVYKHSTQNYYYYYVPNNWMNWGIGLNYTDSMVYMGNVGYEWYIMPDWTMIEGMTAAYGKAWVDTDMPKTWDGYKAELSGGVYTFSDELTAGLTYADVKPEKYQIYTANGEVKVEWITEDFPTAGLILRAPLTDDLDIAETGGKISHDSTAVLGSVNGKNCVVFTNSSDGVTIDFLRSIGRGDYTIFLQFSISEFNSARIYWIANNGGSRIGLECRDQSLKFLYGSDSMHPVNQNQWYTLLVRREEDVITMSLDGVLKDTFKDDYNLTGAMYLGDNNFNGGLRNVLVYDRALTDTEVAALNDKFAAK